MGKKAKSDKLYVEFSTRGEMNLEGNAAALGELATLLVAQGLGPRSIGLDATIDPHPYTMALHAISIEPSSVPRVRFIRDGVTLRIEGSPTDLALLATNISALIAGANQGNAITPHLHLDYYPNHQLIRHDSESVVVSCAA